MIENMGSQEYSVLNSGLQLDNSIIMKSVLKSQEYSVLNSGLQPTVQSSDTIDFSPTVQKSSSGSTDFSSTAQSSSIQNTTVYSNIFMNDLEKLFHITWVTHNSRTSQRMIEYKVKKGEPFILNIEQEIEITSYITQISNEINLKVLAYNICNDHVHILLNCEEKKLPNIVRILKGKSTQLFKKNHEIAQDFNLWARKYNISYIETEEKFYFCINYIKNNRKKHLLPENAELNKIIQKMVDYIDISE